MDQTPQTLERRNKLFMLLRERAFRRGRVVLASGKESDYYFDMKPAMLDPDGAGLMADLILQEIQGVTADAVGGLEMGAVPLIAPVAMREPRVRTLPSRLLRAQGGEGSRHQEARRRQRHRRQDRGDPGGRDHHRRLGHGRGEGGRGGRGKGRAGDLDPRSRRGRGRALCTKPACRSNRCSRRKSFSPASAGR